MGAIRPVLTRGIASQRCCPIQHGALFVFCVCAALSCWVSFLWLLLTLTSGDDAEHPSVTSPVFAGFSIPLVQTLYVQTSYLLTALCVFVVVFAFNALAWMLPSARVAHAVNALLGVLVLVCVAFLVLVVLASQSSTQFSRVVDARDAVVNSTFSEFYCQARGTQLCASTSEGRSLTKLTQMFNGGSYLAATTNSSASLSGGEAMVNVFLGCQHVLIANQGGLSATQQGFFKGVNTSDAVDSWCGSYLLSQVYSDGSESSLAPEANPVSINTHALDLFVASWSNRIGFDEFILGGILSAWILAMVVSWMTIPFTEKAHGSTASDISHIKYTLAATNGVQEDESAEEC